MIKLLPIVVFALLLSFSAPLSVYATSQDDGYVYPDDATEEEKEEIDEREQEAWENAGRPGNNDVSNDDNSYDDDPNPYCDTEKGKAERRFVMIEKITVRLPDCIHVMMGLTKSIGEIVKMQLRTIMIMIIIMIQTIIMEKVVMANMATQFLQA